jgi:hypothetical protein
MSADDERKLRQLMAAMEKISQWPTATPEDYIRRALKLMKLCPWLDEDQVVTVAVFVKGPSP